MTDSELNRPYEHQPAEPPEPELDPNLFCRECGVQTDEANPCDTCGKSFCIEHLRVLDESHQYCATCGVCAECNEAPLLVCPECGSLVCERHAGVISVSDEPSYSLCMRCCP